MQKKDIIMLVIASRGNKYDIMINHYWSKMIHYCKIHPNIKIFLIFGNNVNTKDLNIAEEDKLILNVNDNYIPGILNKTTEAFKVVNIMYDYKHIIRTNLSSFFIIDNLIHMSNQLKNTNLYAGVNGKCNTIPFISGAGIWLSKDNIDYIIKNHSSLDKTLIDDVAIGKLLINHTKGVLDRYDLTNGEEKDDKYKLINDISRYYYHIRINSNKIQVDLNYITKFADILYG